MKIQITRRSHTQAASLVTVLLICGTLSFSVIGYLALITHQSRQSARSQLWNLAIATSEAGVEEGLQQLNGGDLSANGWVASGATYTLTRTLTGGNSFTVTIDNSQPINPTITSRAVIKLSSLARNTPPVFVAVSGVSLDSGEMLTRAIRVRTSRSSLFLAPLVAKKAIDLKGNGILTDSFDSGDLSLSTNGHYDPAKVGDKGDVASNLGIVGVISVQNANIYGKVRTGPGGTASIGSQGAVGSHDWQNAGNKGIQPGWAFEDANFTFPDTTAPYSSGLPIAAGDVLSAVGVVTNTSFVNGSATFPTSVPSGSTLGVVVTNSATVTTTTYPGAIASMTTNTTYTTVSTYPGAMPGLATNIASFTTVASYPGPQPGLTTNYSSNKKKITGYNYASSFNYTYPSLAYSYPDKTFSYSLTQTTTLYTTNHYDNVLQSGDYYAENLTGTVYVSGQARLVLPNGLSMNGNDQFVLGPSASISVYAGGTSVTVGGNGVVNPSGFAGNFILYCAPSVTDFTLNGNGEFIGVVVAPNADVAMNGGGNSDQDFIGALMANSIRMNGHFKFHYDEALARMPANGRFLITSWDEIK